MRRLSFGVCARTRWFQRFSAKQMSELLQINLFGIKSLSRKMNWVFLCSYKRCVNNLGIKIKLTFVRLYQSRLKPDVPLPPQVPGLKRLRSKIVLYWSKNEENEIQCGLFSRLKNLLASKLEISAEGDAYYCLRLQRDRSEFQRNDMPVILHSLYLNSRKQSFS